MLLDALKADAPPLVLSLTGGESFPETKSFVRRIAAILARQLQVFAEWSPSQFAHLTGELFETISPLVLTTAKGATSLLAEAMLRNVTKALDTKVTRRRLRVVTHLRPPNSKVNAIWSLCVFSERKNYIIYKDLSIIPVSAEAATNSGHPLIFKISQESLVRVSCGNNRQL